MRVGVDVECASSVDMVQPKEGFAFALVWSYLHTHDQYYIHVTAGHAQGIGIGQGVRRPCGRRIRVGCCYERSNVLAKTGKTSAHEHDSEMQDESERQR